MSLLIADLSHHNNPTDFAQAKAWGIAGIIHKATEGVTDTDHTYSQHREQARSAGLLWGAYHFFRPSDPIKQVSHFLSIAKPDSNTLLALDHEDELCSAAMAITFLKTLEQLTGHRWPIYSGHLIKEQLGLQVDPYLRTCSLWLAQYGEHVILQPTWDSYFLWQFTGDGKGPGPHYVPGLGKNIDLSWFQGNFAALQEAWSPTPTPVPGSNPNSTPYLATKADQVKWLQASLNIFGAHLLIDGRFGPLTSTALIAFQAKEKLQVTGILDRITMERLLDVLNARV